MEKRTREEGRKKSNKNNSKTVNKMALKTYISIITLNVNGLNATTKRHRLAKWIQKTRPIYMLSLRDPLHFQGHIQIESEKMEENIP